MVETMGPGNYDIERGDAMTRVRTTNITMGTSPSRAQMTHKTATTEIGPGQYAYEKQFGEEGSGLIMLCWSENRRDENIPGLLCL